MRLLIDTHVLVWMLEQPDRIPDNVVAEITNPYAFVAISAASAWEIATKVRLGKLRFDADFLGNFDARVADLGFQPLAVTASHAVAGARIVSQHRDPFDRVLAGQAIVEGLPMVTADPEFMGLGVTLVW